jgi:hypothetical protein
LPLPDGNYNFAFAVPLGSKVGQTFTRWRIHNQPFFVGVTGLAPEGEVEDHEFFIEGRDWGDAPPPYPTTSGVNGAVHKLTAAGGPWFGPADDAPDSDADGQPEPDALGDDNDAQGDDEDGIAIPVLFQNSTQNINVTVSGGGGNVYGWIDFNDDGDWNDPGDLIINGINMPDGVHPVPVTVPNYATPGETFGRFRIISVGGSVDPCGLWDDGEVEDHKVIIEAKRKWSQPADEIDEGYFLGWDELSWYHGEQIVADDWPCENYLPVTDVHWWGSYQYWDDPCGLPAVRPIGFHIGIWTDVPAGVDAPWSHPKEMIWEYRADIAEVNEERVGWDTFPGYPLDVCFHYEVQLPEDDWYWQDPNYAVHWISIAAIYDDFAQPGFPWGWKTRRHVWNDAALMILIPTAPVVGDPYIEGFPIVDPCEMDMAFELTTHECLSPLTAIEPLGHPSAGANYYNTWVNMGYPACWCYPRQCHGDSNGDKEGTPIQGYYYVGITDIGVLAAAWKVKEVPKGPGIQSVVHNGIPGVCADHAHNKAGTPIQGYYYVGIQDIGILATYWKVKEPPKGLGVPPDCGGNLPPVYP